MVVKRERGDEDDNEADVSTTCKKRRSGAGAISAENSNTLVHSNSVLGKEQQPSRTDVAIETCKQQTYLILDAIDQPESVEFDVKREYILRESPKRIFGEDLPSLSVAWSKDNTYTIFDLAAEEIIQGHDNNMHQDVSFPAPQLVYKNVEEVPEQIYGSSHWSTCDPIQEDKKHRHASVQDDQDIPVLELAFDAGDWFEPDLSFLDALDPVSNLEHELPCTDVSSNTSDDSVIDPRLLGDADPSVVYSDPIIHDLSLYDFNSDPVKDDTDTLLHYDIHYPLAYQQIQQATFSPPSPSFYYPLKDVTPPLLYYQSGFQIQDLHHPSMSSPSVPTTRHFESTNHPSPASESTSITSSKLGKVTRAYPHEHIIHYLVCGHTDTSAVFIPFGSNRKMCVCKDVPRIWSDFVVPEPRGDVVAVGKQGTEGNCKVVAAGIELVDGEGVCKACQIREEKRQRKVESGRKKRGA